MLRKTPLRKLKISKDAKTPSEKQRDAQDRYYTKLVTDSPKHHLILASLKEGIAATELAAHFANNNWITVNERTFAEALRTFRRLHQDKIDEFSPENIDKYVDPNAPGLYVEGALSQMMRLQQQRIAIDFKHEKEMGKLFDTTHREIKVFNEMAELALKVNGRTTTPGVRRSGEPSTADVNDNLGQIKKDQGTQDRLHGLTRQLIEAKQ